MVKKTTLGNTILRPHAKTHQLSEIGEIYREFGIDKITVSSVSMAQYFANNGWNNITIAFPVNLTELDLINKLAGEMTLNILVDSVFSIRKVIEIIDNKCGVFIEIDSGYHRSGLEPWDNEISEIISYFNDTSKLLFKGFLTHAGHTYNAKGKTAIMEIAKSTHKEMQVLKSEFINIFPNIISSYGDTPSCSMSDSLVGFDEIRAGNFVYYDVMQYHIGSCQLDDIAVSVACPIVSVYRKRGQAIIYGGAVHLSKEFIAADIENKLYGYVVKYSDKGWGDPIPGAYLSSLSQEHGIVNIPEKHIKDIKPGDILGILPIHSCLTANLLKENYIIY